MVSPDLLLIRSMKLLLLLLQDKSVCQCKPGDTVRQPISMQTMQLQALRTELQAAEATVAELKRLISDLESQ